MTLTNHIAFYVPSTNRSQRISSRDFRIRTDDILEIFCQWFGGATIEKVQGAYTMDNGLVVKEDINKVVSYCTTSQKAEKLRAIIELAQAKRQEYNQESIGIEIDQAFELIEGGERNE